MNACVKVTVHTVLLQYVDKSRKSVALRDLSLSFNVTKTSFVKPTHIVCTLVLPLVAPSPAEWDTQSEPTSQHIVRLQQIGWTRCPLLIPNLILMKTTTKR